MFVRQGWPQHSILKGSRGQSANEEFVFLQPRLQLGSFVLEFELLCFWQCSKVACNKILIHLHRGWHVNHTHLQRVQNSLIATCLDSCQQLPFCIIFLIAKANLLKLWGLPHWLWVFVNQQSPDSLVKLCRLVYDVGDYSVLHPQAISQLQITAFPHCSQRNLLRQFGPPVKQIVRTTFCPEDSAIQDSTWISTRCWDNLKLEVSLPACQALSTLQILLRRLSWAPSHANLFAATLLVVILVLISVDPFALQASNQISCAATYTYFKDVVVYIVGTSYSWYGLLGQILRLTWTAVALPPLPKSPLIAQQQPEYLPCCYDKMQHQSQATCLASLSAVCASCRTPVFEHHSKSFAGGAVHM